MKLNIQLIHTYRVLDNSAHPEVKVGKVITNKHSYSSVEKAVESMRDMEKITWYKDLIFKIVNKETKEVYFESVSEKENNTMKYEVIAMENGEFAVVEAGTNNVYKTYTRKDSARKAANRLNAKEQPAPEKSTVTVELRAFTGMLLGVYEAEKTSKGFKVVTKADKVLSFNQKGEQIGAKNPSFANRISFC